MKMRVGGMLLAIAFWICEAVAADRGTTLTWHGHAAFEVTTPKGAIILIDPWLQNPVNPLGKDKQNPIEHIEKADYILITHGHFDHVGDAVAIAKKLGQNSWPISSWPRLWPSCTDTLRSRSDSPPS
ncbi:MAG: MBL fold metallo-hydrolase [Nitrospiraceae bacterium]